jgi:hypothetical protein
LLSFFFSTILPSVVCERKNGSLTKCSPAERDGAIRVAGRIFGRAAEETEMFEWILRNIGDLLIIAFAMTLGAFLATKFYIHCEKNPK